MVIKSRVTMAPGSDESPLDILEFGNESERLV